jgi:DNA modification methylase
MIERLIQGDCLILMKELPDNCIDTIITDPPYGLKFMSQKWDYDIPTIDAFKEMLRVAKPGSTLLCFGGSRTFHRIAVNIEDAGWEIFDTVMWVYGSGFPKSHNIGKSIDKLKGNEREILREEKELFRQGGNTPFDMRTSTSRELTKGIPEWEGYGTALKPAFEPIICARKANDGTYAENALKWGVSGLNIDGGRITVNKEDANHRKPSVDWHKANAPTVTNFGSGGRPTENLNVAGRFPANIILDEEAGEMLDKQSGIKKGNGHWSKTKVTGFGEFGNGKSEYFGVGEKDTLVGGASRFFYCAKASKSERNAGCENMEIKQSVGGGGMNNTEDDVCGKYGSIKAAGHNFHPTVKPLALMKYLCSLTKTPAGGIILDPYCGSGTTCLAAKLTGRGYIGMDLSEEYLKIAKARIDE